MHLALFSPDVKIYSILKKDAKRVVAYLTLSFFKYFIMKLKRIEKGNGDRLLKKISANVTGFTQNVASKTKQKFVASKDKTQELKNDFREFCQKRIDGLLSKINFDKTIKSLKDYQKTSGKDISNLIDFVEKLKASK